MAPRIGQDPVIIAGAGIGGLATALMLARKGISVVIIEKRTVLDETGAGLQLSPNASRLLLDIGLGPNLMRYATLPERVTIRALTSGNTIGSIALGNYATERYEAPYMVLRRADLHMVLLDAARTMPNIAFLVGRSVTHVAETDSAVCVTTTSAGGNVEDALTPCLIGADGIWSATRASIGERRGPVFSGMEAWRAVLPANKAPAFARKSETGLWLGPRCHMVHYPVASGEGINLVVVMDAALERQGWSTATEADLLHHRMSKAAPVLREMLAGAEDWRVWSLYDFSTKRVSNGRIALVGDAAHPVLPFLAQGAALAIEDAATLGELLETTPEDVSMALRAYQRLRLKRVQRVQSTARTNGRAYHAWGPIAMARNAMMSLKGPHSITNSYDWLYGWQLSID
jgi:salicylate hydroxylase